MNEPPGDTSDSESLFGSAEWYDRSINWSARLAREVPVLMDIFGPPGPGGLIDAGCGTGRQAIALTERGYRVVGLDDSEEMLEAAGRLADEAGQRIEFVCAPYKRIYDRLGGGFDGVYCLGNALAAAGSSAAIAEAIVQFAHCLRPGGRLFIQVLNFTAMRSLEPCVRGPRLASFAGREYLSIRQYHFSGQRVDVTNVTLWHDEVWKKWARSGRLHAIEIEELRGLCHDAELRIDAEWGDYDRLAFDRTASSDLLIVATRGE